MLSYLNGCSFNPSESPDKITRFSSEEAAGLSRYIAEVIENDGNVREPQVRVYCYQNTPIFRKRAEIA